MNFKCAILPIYLNIVSVGHLLVLIYIVIWCTHMSEESCETHDIVVNY